MRKSRIFTIIGILIISLVLNHLTENDNFPFSDSYKFPLGSVISSILLSITILIIAEINFIKFKKTHLTEKFTFRSVLSFLLSTSVYISIAYIIIYSIIVLLKDEDFEFYYFFIGLSVSLLLSILLIIFAFAQDLYDLHKLETITGSLSFKKGGKTFFIAYAEIFYIYSESKIVYLVKADGNPIMTDFRLNELETITNRHQFFRANRQTILHYRAVENFQVIENGKLLVVLKPVIQGKDKHQVSISRYKKKKFVEWMDRKL